MRITCDSCGAKYNVADEKVQGKTVKIRCKKCSNVILVNGKTESSVMGSSPPANDLNAQAGGLPLQPEALYHVNVAENDQRELRMDEVVEGYRAGWITGDMFVWTEGMSDWAPLAQVDAVAGALRQDAPLVSVMPSAESLSNSLSNSLASSLASAASSSGHLSSQASPAAAPVASRPNVSSPFGDPSLGSPSPSAPAGFGPGSFAPAASVQGAEGAPVEARRVRRDDAREGRDLFAAPVGSDPFSFPSSSQHAAATDGTRASRPAPAAAPGLTGERGESSVLFNVGALAVKQPETPSKEDSGIIDLRALVASDDEKATPAVETSEAPIVALFAVAPSSVATPVVSHAQAPSQQRKGGIVAFLALASAGLVLVGGAVTAVVVMRSPEPVPKPVPVVIEADPPAKVKEVAEPKVETPPPVATVVSLDEPNEKKVATPARVGPGPAAARLDPGTAPVDTPAPPPVAKKPAGDPCGGDLACMMKNSVKKKPK